MDSKMISRARGLAALRLTRLGDIADALVSHLSVRHVAWTSVETYLRAAAHFAQWLDRRGSSASRSSVFVFLTAHLCHCRCASPVNRSRIINRAALGHLVKVLRSAGRFDDELPPRTSIDDEMDRFEAFLVGTLGAAAVTRTRRTFDVGQLLTSVFGSQTIMVAKISPGDVLRFMATRGREVRPGTLRVIAVSLRTYFRFLRIDGRCPPGLVEAVPPVAGWRLATIPAFLTTEESKRLLSSFDRRTSRGRRDYAMTMCMFALGLRAGEVAALRLRDVDWLDGRLRVPATKTKRGRELPLIESVGRALAAYVRHGRPQTTSDHLFIRIGVAEGAPIDTGCVTRAVRSAFVRSGLPLDRTGTHRLRHTAATRLAARGAGVKGIADILGHASLDSAAIYAKVDLPRLRAVALPWPKGVR